MWCDWCATTTRSVQTTFRVTKDGHEILIEYCENCLRKSETEYIKGPTTKLHVERAKRPAKRL